MKKIPWDYFDTSPNVPAPLMQQIENILRNPAIDFVWNDRTRHLSHIVPTLAPFDAGDDAATMCGLLTSGADILPSYDWCPECWDAEVGNRESLNSQEDNRG